MKSTAIEDQVLLIWVSNEDLKLVSQKKIDKELVDMANSVKLNEVAAEGSGTEEKENEDDLGNTSETFQDVEGPQTQQ